MRRPSAALVVASAALVMSTIGTSVAATHYVISSPRQIKPGTISLNALSKGASKALRGATRRARAGAARQVRPEPSERRERRDCRRRSSGRRSGPTGASTPRAAASPRARASTPGTYAVNFGQDITHCAAMATQGAIPHHAAAGRPQGRRRRTARARLQRGTDLAPGFPSVELGAVTTTSEAAMGAPTPTTFSRRGLLLTREACA